MRSSTFARLSAAALSVVSLASLSVAFAACSGDDDASSPGADGGGATDSSVGDAALIDGGTPSGDAGSPGTDGSTSPDGGAMADGGDGGAPLTDDGCVVNLPGDCDAPVAAYSVNARIVSAYPVSAPLFRVVRIPDLVGTPVLQAGQGTFAGASGTPDVTQIEAWLASASVAGSTAVVTTVFDQSGKANDATQASVGAAPLLRIDDSVPSAVKLSLVFSNQAAKVHAGYVSDPSNGNNLAIAAETDADPTTATLAPLTAPTTPGYPSGAPYPLIVAPEHWVLPGFTIMDKSLPDGGVPVVSVSDTSLVLAGQPTETKHFSNSLTIVPEKVWLDLPAGVSVHLDHHSLLMAVRSGYDGTEYFLTLGQSGGAAKGAGAYSAFYGAGGPFALGNDSQSKGATSLLSSGTTSTDIDVYEVARSSGTVDFALGEQGSGQITDSSTETATLSGGSIGYTAQLTGKDDEGSFEDYGMLVYGSTLSAHDAAAIQGQLRGELALPPVPTTQVVYTGASTVNGHGIDSVEAPAKRIGVDLTAQGHAARAYSVTHLTEALLTDLTSGGPVTDLYKATGGTKILVIHPTVSDSWGNYLSGQWPAQCVLGDGGTMSLADCLWTITSLSVKAAETMGWKVVVLSTEPKASFFAGQPPSLDDFLRLKTLISGGWQAAGASAYADFETIPAIGGSDGKGGFSHCAFWDSYCVGFMDPAGTQTAWEPDGMHLSQSGYDATADLIAAALVKAGLD